MSTANELSPEELDRRWRAAWWMWSRQDLRTSEEARGAVEAKGLEVVDVTEGRIGRFTSIRAWKLRTTLGVGAFPWESAGEVLQRVQLPRRKSLREFWTSLGWFHPAYICNGATEELRRVVGAAPPEAREAALAQQLSALYHEQHFASMIVDRYPELPEFTEHLPLIREAAEAFCAGLTRVAITALVPVVEGLLAQFLDRLSPDAAATGMELMRQVVAAETTRAIDALVYHGMWVPPEYKDPHFAVATDEYLGMLACFERFGAAHFFASTTEFDAGHGLNRHAMLHGSLTGCEKPQNFFRLWSILDMLAFAMTMSSSGISALAPSVSPRASLRDLPEGAELSPAPVGALGVG